jgi:hypothetical protein
MQVQQQDKPRLAEPRRGQDPPSMKRLVEFQVGDDPEQVVLVEIDEPTVDAGVERAARRGEVTGKAARTIAESIDSILPAAEAVMAKLRSSLHAPDFQSELLYVSLSN